MAEGKPLDGDAVDRLFDLIYGDIKGIPPEYRRAKVYATYHRIVGLIIDGGEQTPQIGEGEDKALRAYREDGFSYHDVAYIFRRSSASVHSHLRDLRFEEAVDRVLAEK